jgi:hypothetical protein
LTRDWGLKRGCGVKGYEEEVWEMEGGWGKRYGDDIQGLAVPAWWKGAKL